uniref:CRC domain-containing protein n=1 Tax=Ditylenchus dipsaci TaxID=166011 RepID=A0A915CN44_9BILA
MNCSDRSVCECCKCVCCSSSRCQCQCCFECQHCQSNIESAVASTATTVSYALQFCFSTIQHSPIRIFSKQWVSSSQQQQHRPILVAPVAGSVVNLPPTPLLPSYPYNQPQQPAAGSFRTAAFAHVASPTVNVAQPGQHYYSLTPQQVASVQQSSNAY